MPVWSLIAEHLNSFKDLVLLDYIDYGGSKHALKLRCSKISEMMIAKDEGTTNLEVIRTHLDNISERLSPRVREALERSLANAT